MKFATRFATRFATTWLLGLLLQNGTNGRNEIVDTIPSKKICYPHKLPSLGPSRHNSHLRSAEKCEANVRT